MAHVKFFSAWKNQDLNTLKEMLSTEMQATFIGDHNQMIQYNYDQVVALFQERFIHEQDWMFEIISRYKRTHQEIIITNIYREDESVQLIEKKSFAIFTFETGKQNNTLIRVHMEMELD